MHTEGPRLRVALVGAGLVGQAEHAFHLWEERERFELAAVVDARRPSGGPSPSATRCPSTAPRSADVDASGSTRSSSPCPTRSTATPSSTPSAAACTSSARSRWRCPPRSATTSRPPPRPAATRHAGRLHEAPRPVGAAAARAPARGGRRRPPDHRRGQRSRPGTRSSGTSPMVAARDVPAELIARLPRAHPRPHRRRARRRPVAPGLAGVRGLPVLDGARREPAARDPRAPRRAVPGARSPTRPPGTGAAASRSA